MMNNGSWEWVRSRMNFFLMSQPMNIKKEIKVNLIFIFNATLEGNKNYR